MKAITRPAVVVLLLVITLTTTAIAQQKRQTTPKPQSKPAAPAPTFDTLVPADTYLLYGEIRGVGQFIRSSSLNELLEPVLTLSGPPKEFRTILKWLNAHSAGFDVTLKNVSEDTYMLAFQGPKAQEVLQRITDIDLSAIKFHGAARGQVAGARARGCRNRR